MIYSIQYHLLSLLFLTSLTQAIQCYTDAACTLLADNTYACNSTAQVTCTEAQACLSYYTAPDGDPSLWSSKNWTRHQRGCASDDVVTSLFDTATSWSTHCGFGSDRLTELMKDDGNQTSQGNTITTAMAKDGPVMSLNINISQILDATSGSIDSSISTPSDNSSNVSGSLNLTELTGQNFPLPTPLEEFTSSTMESVSTTEETSSSSTEESSSTISTESSSMSSTEEPSSTTETDPGDEIVEVTQPSRRKRGTPLPPGYAGCLCYTDNCNGLNDQFGDEINKYVAQRVTIKRGGDEPLRTDYEDTGAEPETTA